jgi:Flp pilus assembly protein TadB
MLVTIAVFILMPVSPEPRLRRIVGTAPKRHVTLSSRQRGLGAATVVGIGAFAIVGVMPGIVIAVAGFLILPVLMSKLESSEARRHRETLDRQLPESLDALTSMLEAGALPAEALRAVGTAWSGPLGHELARVAKAMQLGASAEQAWASTHASLASLARAMSRSAESGAPLALVLTGVSADARRKYRVRVEVAARSAGVKAVAPLAACFLPAFFLMGVAPIIATFVEQILSS